MGRKKEDVKNTNSFPDFTPRAGAALPAAHAASQHQRSCLHWPIYSRIRRPRPKDEPVGLAWNLGIDIFQKHPGSFPDQSGRGPTLPQPTAPSAAHPPSRDRIPQSHSDQVQVNQPWPRPTCPRVHWAKGLHQPPGRKQTGPEGAGPREHTAPPGALPGSGWRKGPCS